MPILLAKAQRTILRSAGKTAPFRYCLFKIVVPQKIGKNKDISHK